MWKGESGIRGLSKNGVMCVILECSETLLRICDVVLCANKNRIRHVGGGGPTQFIAAGCHFSI